MLKFANAFIIGAGFLPLLVRWRYFAAAWRSSPLDRWDWVGALAGAGLIAAALWRERRNAAATDHSALIFLLFGVGVLGAGWLRSINLLYFAAGALLPWTLIWWRLSWRRAWLTVPGFALLLLALPTSALYGLTPDLNWPLVKLAGGAAAICAMVLLSRLPVPGMNRGLFLLGLGLFFLFSNYHDIPARFGASLLLDPERLSVPGGGVVAVSQELTEHERRFFAGSRDVGRFIFFTPGGERIELLAIESGDDLSSIHSPRVCLLSAGWSVVRSGQADLRLGARLPAVEELETAGKGRSFLLYVWYTNADYSTSGFLSFRRAWRRGSNWHVYQLSTPIIAGDVDSARKRLNLFIERTALPDAGFAAGGEASEK